MFALLVCVSTLHLVHSACVLQGICTENISVQNEIVERHNEFRREVSPPASDMLLMSYDEQVAASAQAWVDNCHIAHGDPSTRTLDGYLMGENLFYSPSLSSWTDVITAWHDEVKHFVYPDVSTNGKPIGHYTQVIWNSSYKVGCGVALCANGIYFYACHYYRAGNFIGWRPYTIGEPCASCPNDCVDKLCTNPCPYIDHFLNCPSLKSSYGCGNKQLKSWCPASCGDCDNKIIPIAKK